MTIPAPTPLPLSERPDVLTAAEVAEVLRCSVDAVYDMTARGALYALSPGMSTRGKGLRFPKAALYRKLAGVSEEAWAKAVLELESAR